MSLRRPNAIGLRFGIAAALLGSTGFVAAAEPSAEDVEFFEKKIRPVLVKECYECHSGEAKQLKGGLRLDTRDGVLKGGDSGPAVVPGKPKEGHLLASLKQETFEMPPKGKLSDAVIADFQTWIERGAADPRESAASVAKSIDFAEARKFWSFQPPKKAPRPAVKNAAWPQGEIDYFLLAAMEAQGLKPVAPATKREWIRRATFDLIGLPPTPEEIDAFLADETPQAYATVVERLLASPHYGERWGRYWLDVARYAEDQAHTFGVRPNSSGWRYRDWVVDAFNQDLPYDQFVTLQIAGDLVEGKKDPSAAPSPHLAALGFFGLGAQYYKNTDAAKAAADELDDRVDTLTRGFLGLTVSCARCHDHKFDPIPTQDYYSLAGVFSSSKLMDAPLASKAEVDAFNAGQTRVKQAEEKLKRFFAEERKRTAEAEVASAAKYLQTVWRLRAAGAKKPSTKDVAQAAGLHESTLRRWLDLTDEKRRGELPILAGWNELKAADLAAQLDAAGGKDAKSKAEALLAAPLPGEVLAAAEAVQTKLQETLAERDGPKEAAGQVAKGMPRYVSPLINQGQSSVDIDVDVTGASKLFLVVTDSGNGMSCDHADWAEPRLVGPGGETKLTDLAWKSAETGYGEIKKHTNFNGAPLRVAGKTFAYGIGTHAPARIVYDLPAGATRFKALAGIDASGLEAGCAEQATIQFRIYTEAPADLGPGPGGKPQEPKLSEEQKRLLEKTIGEKGVFSLSDGELEKALEGEGRRRHSRMKDELEEAKKSAPPQYALAHVVGEANPADMQVFLRGNPARKGEPAPRRFLKVIAGDEPKRFTSGSGRKELAAAIVDPSNPLTARVMVNRIWQQHFGRGLVGTPSNFGSLGDRPSHPELLDYLAVRFVEAGWSVKAMHREIMLSAAYRSSSRSDDENLKRDPEGRFLWRFPRRRLDVEAWRDALLEVAGRLDPKIGGPSTDLGNSANSRRTIYGKISRHDLDGLLRLFDFPDANITSDKRSETTVPQQQLFVLNSPFMVEQSRAFVRRLEADKNADSAAKVRKAFLLAYGRPAEDAEVDLIVDYVSREDAPEADGAKKNKLTRWERVAQAILSANELMYID